MNLFKNAPALSSRVNKGSMLLRNAQVLDTRLVKARLDIFSATHRRYIEAVAKVDEATDLERQEAQTIEKLDAQQDKAVEALAVALINDRQPRKSPFDKFSVLSPSEIVNMAMADEAKAIQALVHAVKLDDMLSKKTHNVAERAAAAALQIEAALPAWETRRVFLSGVRQERDNIGVQWDIDYAALRHLTRSLVETPVLYERLFREDSRLARKNRTPNAPPNQAENPPTPANPVDKAA